MPIYDSDGSANREIGKAYDHNGSVNTQIGKVYDNNGSANSLIYSSDFIIIGNNRDYTSGWSVIGGPYVNWGTITDYGTSVYMKASGGSTGNYAGSGDSRTAVKIDLTGFSLLYFTLSGCEQMKWGRVGLTTVDQNGKSGLGNHDGFLDNSCIYQTDRKVMFNGANGNYSINVSDLNGYYYIYFGMVNNYPGPISFATLSNMYLI